MSGVCADYADTRNLSIKDRNKCIPSAFLHFNKQVLPRVLFYLFTIYHYCQNISNVVQLSLYHRIAELSSILTYWSVLC